MQWLMFPIVSYYATTCNLLNIYMLHISDYTIYEYRLFFLRIEVEIGVDYLITEAGKIQLIGGIKLLTNERKKKSITFNGVDQYFNIPPHSGSCLADPDECYLGITLSFVFKFLAFKEDTYLYTNCGDQPEHTGYSIYYRNERLYFVVSTLTRQYTLFIDDLQLNKYYDLRLSYSEQFGLSLYQDGFEILKTTDFIERGITLLESCPIYVGRGHENDQYINIELEYWHILLASLEVLESLGFTIGKIISIIIY